MADRLPLPPTPREIMNIHSFDIEEGDWIRLNDSYGEAWREGHVEGIKSNGDLVLGFGGKSTTAQFRLHSYPVPQSDVIEVWRKVQKITKTKFPFEGKLSDVTSIEYDWVRIR